MYINRNSHKFSDGYSLTLANFDSYKQMRHLINKG